MNVIGGGFIPVIVYPTHAHIVSDFPLLTEDYHRILTENNIYIEATG